VNEATDPRSEFSEWLHTELLREFAQERERWAIERVQRVQSAINAARIGRPPLETVILWIPAPLAFTLVGRYVYLSRSLLERLPTDDAVAFILAHEAAHHDLGHLDLFAGWAEWLPRTHAGGYVALLTRLLEHRTYGPEREADADEYAIRLVLRSRYNSDLATKALSILETLALDRGDIAGVFGPENLLDPTDPKHSSTGYQIQRWLWTHIHGYHPLHERLINVRKVVSSIDRGAVA
jgi:predicted Zn-dependent protease